MALDPVRNFALVTVSTGYGSGDTSVVLSGGHGAKLPAPATDGAFNLVWWNSTDYLNPSDDVSVEIVRCTARATDTLTVTRAQEGTAAANHNTSGKIYKMILSPTKLLVDNLNTHVVGTAKAQHTGGMGDHSHQSAGAEGGQLDHGLAMVAASLLDDDHTQYIKHSLATAGDDFLVASGAGAFVKKTLAEIRTLVVASYLPWMIDIDPFSTPKSNVNWNTISVEPTAIRNGEIVSSGVQNDEITWDVVLAAGTWTLDLTYYRAPNRGICSVQFDSVEKGTIDLYGGLQVNTRVQITGIVVATTAKVELKFKMATKNASSTAYYGTLNGLRLIRTA